MADSCIRKFSMLRLIPRWPAQISTNHLLIKLNDEGFKTTQRTIQRDLNDLASFFPDLITDGNKDMAGWSWEKDSELLSFPAIDPPVAFTLKLADTFLSKLMPPAVTDLLEPFRKSSNKILSAGGRSNLSRWKEKVQVLPRTQQLIPAKIKPEVIRVIYSALFDGKQFSGHYRRKDNDIANYDFNPLGIVYRESVIYLVASLWEYDDVKQFALHRFKKVEEKETPLRRIKGFKLTEYIDAGNFDYCNDGKTLKLRALFNETGAHLLETPLSEDQKISVKADGSYLVTATVNDGMQLRWWLLGFGDQVEVLKPKSLRDEFTAKTESMHMLYHNKKSSKPS